MKFRKKPVVIEAFKWTGDTKPFPQEFKDAICCKAHDGIMGNCHIHTLEGIMEIGEHDWIIKGVAGEFYPCKTDIFEKTYEPLNL